MANQFVDRLFSSISGKSSNARKRASRRPAARRQLAFESLESRQMLSITSLADLSVSNDTGQKPQSKIWEYQSKWYAVMPNSSGTWLFRLEGTTWSQQLKLSTSKSVEADVLADGNLTYILLYSGTSSQFATVQFDTGLNNYKMSSQQPQPVNISLSSGVETATIALDSTGRMWLASDASSTIEVRYSDGNYSSWSAPITVATGVTGDDISAIIEMPNHQLGIFWSDQSTKRFGFRTHVDGTLPTLWTTNEVPAGQYAFNKVHGMADDHMHLSVASDGTLYVAAKTGYDTSGYAQIILLVRRPNGVWDAPYTVDNGGTRPVIVLDEVANRLVIAYTSKDGGGNILYRWSPLGTISLSPVQTLIAGSTNNVTTTKQEFTDDVVFMAEGGSKAKSVTFRFDGVNPIPVPTGPVNLPPVVNAGSDQSIVVGSSVQLAGIVTDDQLPNPPGTITTTWSKVSGPGNVSFTNGSATSTGASFSLAGQYVLRLSASDGAASTTDDLTVTVIDPSSPVTISFQDGASPTGSYQGTRDTKLDSGAKTSNFGTTATYKADGSPDIGDLFDWDISAIPTSGIVDSATIQLNATSASSKSFPLYVMNRAWDELAATWNQASSGNPWSVAGASGAADHGSTAIGQITPTKKGLAQIVLNQAGIAALQAWVNNPSSNFGVILQNYAITDGFQITTSETSTVSQRPKLTITYHVPANLTPSQIAALTVGPVNQKPQVNTGVAQTITLPAAATLHPSLADDGLPTPATLSTTWIKVSGPGIVTFGNAATANTSAQFSIAGTYVLRLTVSDGLLSASSDLTITVLPPLVV